MAVSSVKEIWRGRDGDDSSSPSVRIHSRVFRVVTDDPYDDAEDIYASGLLPAIGAAHPNNASATCRRRRGRNESFSPKVWIFVCSYSTEQRFEPTDNPLNDPADIQWETQQFQKIITEDRNGDAIVSSAGQPFREGGLLVDDSRVIAVVRKNIASVPSWIGGFRDRVNSSGFTIDGYFVEAEKAKMQAIRLSGQRERSDIEFRTLTLRIAVDDNGWNERVLDQGTIKKNGSERVAILNDDGTNVTEPVLLDGSGQPIPDPEKSDGVYLEFEKYQLENFAILEPYFT